MLTLKRCDKNSGLGAGMLSSQSAWRWTQQWNNSDYDVIVNHATRPLWICSTVHLADVIGCNNMLMLKNCKSANIFATYYFISHVRAASVITCLIWQWDDRREQAAQRRPQHSTDKTAQSTKCNVTR